MNDQGAILLLSYTHCNKQKTQEFRFDTLEIGNMINENGQFMVIWDPYKKREIINYVPNAGKALIYPDNFPRRGLPCFSPCPYFGLLPFTQRINKNDLFNLCRSAFKGHERRNRQTNLEDWLPPSMKSLLRPSDQINNTELPYALRWDTLVEPENEVEPLVVEASIKEDSIFIATIKTLMVELNCDIHHAVNIYHEIKK